MNIGCFNDPFSCNDPFPRNGQRWAKYAKVAEKWAKLSKSIQRQQIIQGCSMSYNTVSGFRRIFGEFTETAACVPGLGSCQVRCMGMCQLMSPKALRPTLSEPQGVRFGSQPAGLRLPFVRARLCPPTLLCVIPRRITPSAQVFFKQGISFWGAGCSLGSGWV